MRASLCSGDCRATTANDNTNGKKSTSFKRSIASLHALFVTMSLWSSSSDAMGNMVRKMDTQITPRPTLVMCSIGTAMLIESFIKHLPVHRMMTTSTMMVLNAMTLGKVMRTEGLHQSSLRGLVQPHPGLNAAYPTNASARIKTQPATTNNHGRKNALPNTRSEHKQLMPNRIRRSHSLGQATASIAPGDINKKTVAWTMSLYVFHAVRSSSNSRMPSKSSMAFSAAHARAARKPREGRNPERKSGNLTTVAVSTSTKKISWNKTRRSAPRPSTWLRNATFKCATSHRPCICARKEGSR
mmetsp:Transcript_126950/g.329368  ORF Transcript_126950/g.329368 Transcript_126950/m.329368 type:complete len:299 (-) Transcript_126950:2567-3463(-)